MNKQGLMPFHIIASREKDFPELLLKYDAKIDAVTEDGRHVACINGHRETGKLLLT